MKRKTLFVIMALFVMCFAVERVAANNITLTFREGLDEYAYTKDTYLSELYPDTSFGDDPEMICDQPTMGEHTLLRFENIFGNSANQIPAGSEIIFATLRLYQTDTGNVEVYLHRMLQEWTEQDTWNEWSDGIQPNNVEACMSADAFVPATVSGPSIFLSIDVTASLTAWSSGTANYGWVLLPGTNTYDGRTLVTSESVEFNLRPELTVIISESDPIQKILDFIQKSVADGTLAPVKEGKAGQGQLGALINMIEAAGNLIDANDPNLLEDICGQLHAALGKTDGQDTPPDFVTGPAAPQLAAMIEELMDSLGCN